MPSVAILGGSVVGSVAALLFARSGWTVTVVDPEVGTIADADPEHVEVRPGAPHTVHAHGFMSRTLHELSTRLPDVKAALVDAGAPMVPLGDFLPPHLYDGGRAGDDELTTLRVRRVTLDRVLAGTVATEPGITRVVQRATGLVVDAGVPPTVRGLGLRDGSVVKADVVLDAGGRRSPVSAWLTEIGAAPLTRHDQSMARYYTRHFTIRTGATPPLNRGFAEVHDFPSLTQLLFLGDNATVMLAQAVHDEDPVLKALRLPEAFDATVTGNEALAAWWEVLEATSDVFCLGAFDNRLRSLVSDRRPLVLGLFQVGDALATTNPTRGRGISLGLSAVGRLHDLLTTESLTGAGAATAYAQWVSDVLAVYYRETAAVDEALARRLRAGLVGEAVPLNAPAVELPNAHPFTAAELDHAASLDADLMRVLLRATMLMDDDRQVASTAVAGQVASVLAGAPETGEARAEPTGGLHDRVTLVAALAAFL